MELMMSQCTVYSIYTVAAAIVSDSLLSILVHKSSVLAQETCSCLLLCKVAIACHSGSKSLNPIQSVQLITSRCSLQAPQSKLCNASEYQV